MLYICNTKKNGSNNKLKTRIMEALALWVVCAIAGGMIYQSKNRPFINGFLWGLLLGVVGLIVTIAKPSLKES